MLGCVQHGKARVIDASGMFVMPGGIDPHTHLDMPFGGTLSCDDFYRCCFI
jgi:dihydropyrimidinase